MKKFRTVLLSFYYNRLLMVRYISSTVKFYCSIILLLLTVLGNSCKKNEGVADNFPTPKDSVETINRWILDSMATYYYWGDAIKSPISLAGKPETFFTSLLNAGDRFSWISDGKTIPTPKTSYSQYGFEYLLTSQSSFSSSSLLGVLVLVAPQSASAYAGLERGMYFSKVNNQPIQQNNMATMNELLKTGNKITLTLVKDSSGNWKEYGTKTVSSQYFENRPVYKTQVFEKAGKKTGYLFYHSFTELFDGDVFTAFANLKDQQVSELILDLRYNGGGSTASASKIIALASTCKSTDIFSIFKGNNTLKSFSQSFGKAIASSSSVAGKDFSQIINSRPGINRIFILSSPATASAAEMVVNNLKPYTQVILIGEKTTGKDMAGAIIKDLRQPKKISWFMQPLIYKIYNSQNLGEYANGITPDHIVEELQILPLYDLGSKNDPLIKNALQLIYGDNNVSVAILSKDSGEKEKPIGKIIFNSVRNRSAPAVIIPNLSHPQ